MLRILCTYGKKLNWAIGLCSVFLILCSSCNTTKFVPQGEYLLDKANVKCVDDKTVSTNTLRGYLRQKQNTEVMGFWKLQLDIYNTAPRDTTTKSKKRLARNAHKMGEAPVVYDEELTRISMLQLKQQMCFKDRSLGCGNMDCLASLGVRPMRAIAYLFSTGM